MGETKVAVVTGANRGIGREIVRQLARLGFHTILTARDAAKGEAAAEELRREGLPVFSMQLDVTDPASIEAFATALEEEHGRLDALVNNAGIFVDRGANALTVSEQQMRETFETNTLAPLMLTQALVPLMKKTGQARVVMLSSTLGQLSTIGGGYAAYRMSKAALNAVAAVLAADLKRTNILVNTMHPGWVKTDMGGPQAPLEVEQGADTAVFLATLPDGGPTGKFFADRKEIAW